MTTSSTEDIAGVWHITEMEMEDDEDSMSTYMARYLISTLYRLRQDITFYINPATVVDLTGDVIPAVRTLSDFTKAMDSSLQYIYDADYQGDPVRAWGRSFPVTRQITQSIWLAQNNVAQ